MSLTVRFTEMNARIPLSTDESANNNGQVGHALLFEIAWEVCSQAGGIYTVLRSKAPATVNRWQDNYWLIGPLRGNSNLEFEPEVPTGVVAEALAELAARGIRVHCGRWLITGRPRVLLVDTSSVAHKMGELKYFYWKDCGIGTPDGDGEVDQIIALGFVTADLLMAIHARMNDRPMLAHFHEWQGGAALPILAHRKAAFPTIFTTHATLVGRSLSAANANLYDHLNEINGEAVAHQHQFWHRFAIERACAHSATIFTTVSEITALEAAQFLGRKPEFLLPNGLNIERFAAPYEFQNLHRRNKELIHDFVIGHFFPHHTFDLEQTLYIFTAGRYEFRNKGFDLFIEALHELNLRLKAERRDVTVVAFIIAPAPYRALNVETLNRQAMLTEIKNTCQDIQQDMGRRLYHTVTQGRAPTTDDLFDEYAAVRIKRMLHVWRRSIQPPIVTHDLWNDGNDQVLNHLRYRNLLNAADDPVKVVFHPEFITSTSPILGLEYDQFVRGCNLGVFPSYYEPWGYTPMECVVRGIPAITSDLSGFGKYVMEHFPDHDLNGVFVARRQGVAFHDTVRQVADWLHILTRMSRRDRIQLRNRVEAHAEHFDWTNLSKYYREARQHAFGLFYPGRQIVPGDTGLPDVPAPLAESAGPQSDRRRIGQPQSPVGG
ncbi:MAG: glycosyltransferase [Phycisphaerae bacterium]|nr:glycosyltransferase [Phycisphaerae bacterium]